MLIILTHVLQPVIRLLLLIGTMLLTPTGEGMPGSADGGGIRQPPDFWYVWPRETTPYTALQQRFPPPAGFERVDVDSGSFGAWLRGLPLKERGARVKYYNGIWKPFQQHHAAVIDIDCGNRDLQQCADAAIRLHAEYLHDTGHDTAIQYNFTSGDRCAWKDWKQGIRPRVKGNTVTFEKTSASDSSYAAFRAYLNMVFRYAGTLSLSRDLETVDADEVRPGDVFVQGGSPGHAVLVVDVAVNLSTGQKAMLLAQGYTPAQDIHVLKNHGNRSLSPWYIVGDGPELTTPEWTFSWQDAKRFPG